jgi:hypothetical protein
LIEGGAGFGSARIYRRGPFDGGEGSAGEQKLADEFGQPNGKHFDAVGLRGDAQQQVGNHCSKHLEADRVVVGAEELADIEMLLDPAEQQLDLPSALVEGSDLDGAAGKVVWSKA